MLFSSWCVSCSNRFISWVNPTRLGIPKLWGMMTMANWFLVSIVFHSLFIWCLLMKRFENFIHHFIFHFGFVLVYCSYPSCWIRSNSSGLAEFSIWKFTLYILLFGCSFHWKWLRSMMWKDSLMIFAFSYCRVKLILITKILLGMFNRW